jgi:hypothetical protein
MPLGPSCNRLHADGPRREGKVRVAVFSKLALSLMRSRCSLVHVVALLIPELVRERGELDCSCLNLCISVTGFLICPRLDRSAGLHLDVYLA